MHHRITDEFQPTPFHKSPSMTRYVVETTFDLETQPIFGGTETQ